MGQLVYKSIKVKKKKQKQKQKQKLVAKFDPLFSFILNLILTHLVVCGRARDNTKMYKVGKYTDCREK